MHKTVTYSFVLILFVLLVVIRLFEDVLFYDPYLVFFKNDYLYIDSPRREILKLIGFTGLRYVLNTIISLGVLYLIFKDKDIVKLSTIIYIITFVILIAIYLYFVINPKQEDYYLFFSIRRFLIHPVLLIILLPAFYYHKLSK